MIRNPRLIQQPRNLTSLRNLDKLAIIAASLNKWPVEFGGFLWLVQPPREPEKHVGKVPDSNMALIASQSKPASASAVSILPFGTPTTQSSGDVAARARLNGFTNASESGNSLPSYAHILLHRLARSLPYPRTHHVAGLKRDDVFP